MSPVVREQAAPEILSLDISRKLWFPLAFEIEPPTVQRVLLKSHEQPVRIQGSQSHLVGAELLAADALHSLADEAAAVAAMEMIHLPGSTVEKVSSIVFPAAERLAELVAAKTIEVENRPENARLKKKIEASPVLKAVLGAKIIATNCHDGEFRLNDEPYETHPNGVDTMVRDSTKKPLRDYPLEQSYLRIVSWVHDAWEHAYPKDGTSPLGTHRFLGSPLVLRQFLQKVGVPEADSLRLARYQLLLTHTVPMNVIVALREAAGKPLDPKGLEFEHIKDVEYKAGITILAPYPGAAIPKRADIKYNADFDPKPISKDRQAAYAKWLAKLGVYEWSADYLHSAMSTWPTESIDYKVVMRNIDKMRKKQLDRPPMDRRGFRMNRISPDSLLIDRELWATAA